MKEKIQIGLIRETPYIYTDPDPVEPEHKHTVFIIHGHNHLPLHQVRTFLTNANLDVVVLKEEPGCSQSVIEKIESHSNVDFVVALLTADDKGGTTATPSRSLKLRARQNVIFELGYFSGKLGRHKVCALASRGIEIPSDFAGFECIALGESGWEWKLAKELKAAELRVDLNSAMARNTSTGLGHSRSQEHVIDDTEIGALFSRRLVVSEKERHRLKGIHAMMKEYTRRRSLNMDC
jgi:hypothetical protein